MSSSFDKRIDEMFEEDPGSQAHEQTTATLDAWQSTQAQNPVIEKVLNKLEQIDPAAASALFSHLIDKAEADLERDGRSPDRGGGSEGVEQDEAPEGFVMDFVADSLIGHGVETHDEPTESFGGGGGGKPPGDTASSAGWMPDDYAEGGEGGGEGDDEGEGEGEGEGGGEGKGKGDKDKSAKAAKASKGKDESGGRAARGKGDEPAGDKK